MFADVDASDESARRLVVDTQVYGQEAVFRACYAFTDRCYLFLREVGSNAIELHFRKRQSPKTLDVLVAEFANELINQRMRVQIAAETKVLREMIVSQAFNEADL